MIRVDRENLIDRARVKFERDMNREYHEILQNVPECRCLIYGLQQNVTMPYPRIVRECGKNQSAVSSVIGRHRMIEKC